MNEPDQTEMENALPLVEAAARLGLTTDALRARLRRGRARGVRRDGRVYVYVGAETETDPVGSVRTMSEQFPPHRPSKDEARATIEQINRDDLERLRRDNDRLNNRVDDLLKLQEREQVLRQQTQAFLDKIGDRLAAPEPRASAPDLDRRLERNEADLEILKTAIAQLVRYLGKREP